MPKENITLENDPCLYQFISFKHVLIKMKILPICSFIEAADF